MMGLGRERRLNCRLYVERRADADVVKKLDRLLEDKRFLNQTELIKHGIELVYSEVYENEKAMDKVSMSGENVQTLAEMITDVLKPELQQMLACLEARIVEGVNVANASATGTGVIADNALVEAVVSTENETATTVQEPEKKPIEMVHEEKALLGSAISFLKGLNDD